MRREDTAVNLVLQLDVFSRWFALFPTESHEPRSAAFL